MLTADKLNDLSFPFRKKVSRSLLLRIEFAFDDKGCQPVGRMFTIEDIAFVDGEDSFLDLFFIGILQQVTFGAGGERRRGKQR